ncbi:hypothetical protein ZEAMMB73_Zm00001d037181 [Zea mays]|uniref:Uncharacterized protein n=1 Tax=Zea mays TaxID=4577 RepID=A0A1D6LVE6_MAIZE|nr:hypothetical protein ZEAMMB73_Zm00001d037181 [Zea mays]
MELKKSPASSSPPPPPTGFRSDSAAASPYVTAPSSPRGRLVPSEGAAGALFLTAPPSPSPFGLLPPATPTRLTGADPFDLFQHFTRPPLPPPGLLDGGSVTPSPRSPVVARGAGATWSPRRRSRVGSGVDFDPFTAALLEATKAPSPLGGKDDEGGVAVAPHGSPPTRPATRPASRSAGWRRWRLSDLLLFRSSSDGGRVNSSTCPSRGRAQQPPAVTIKASATKREDMGKGWKHGDGDAAAAADSVAGCARLSPLQRLAKGLGAYSWHNHRGMAAPATKG